MAASLNEVFDVLIIGCGAVGAAVAREMALLGQKCIVLEKNMDVLSEASSGNTGHLTRGFHYTKKRSPLEFEMVRRALKLNKEWLDLQVNVPRSHCGLLMIAMNEEEFNTISEYQVKGIANGEDVRIIGKRELVKLEPNLSVVQDSVGALYSPEECLADGFLLALSNLYVALYHGCHLETRCRVVKVKKDLHQGVWKVTAEKRAIKGGKLSKLFLRARKVINCGGNYSDEVDHLVPRTMDEEKPFTIQPGRGEYVVLSASSKNGGSSTAGPMGMVTQVPTKTYAGLYVFKSVYGHYVVGPTNVPQDSKEDRGCDVDNVADMKNHIFSYFPGLKDHEMIATYSGLRPRSPEFHDYQIRFNKDLSWATLGAIRSTGLTASRSIAEYCAKNLFSNEPYEAMMRKEDVVMPAPEPQKDGTVKVGQFTFRPTHKLSQLGLMAPSPQNSSAAATKSTL